MPSLDRRLVALRRPFDGLLPTPPHVTQQPTDVIWMVAHAEAAPDHLGHPLGGPHVAAEPVRFCPLCQERRELRPLLLTRPWNHAGRCPTRKGLNAALLAGAFEPLAHRPFTDSQRHGDVLLQPALLLQGPGALAPLLAPIGLLWCS